MTVRITSNNRPRDLFALSEIPEDARADFGYIEGDECYSDRLFKFRDSWYDIYEFDAVNATDPQMARWDGVQPQSYFDAVVIRYADDFESVVVGHATW